MSEEADTNEPCKHTAKISSCGIKVCFDCGAPLNAKARAIATRPDTLAEIERLTV